MHGYDIHGSPPPQHPPQALMGGPMNDGGGGGPLQPLGPLHSGGGPPDMGQHGLDSNDRYVTYLESDSDSLHPDTRSP